MVVSESEKANYNIVKTVTMNLVMVIYKKKNK